MIEKRVLKKICLLGDGGVGKTSLIKRFVFNTFNNKYIETFGTRVSKKKISIASSDKKYDLTLLVWDILGQKMYDKIHSTYYKGASGGLVVCDLARRKTLENIENWVKAFHRIVPGKPIIFLGNKCDLKEREFGTKDLKEIATPIDTPFYLTSAKTGENVEKVFHSLGELVVGDG